MLRRYFGWGVLAAATLVLASCSALEDEARYPCPKVFILGDAGNMVRFKPGPGRDITDIVFEARIANFSGSCEYEKGGVDIELVVRIDVQRGPASPDRRIAFDYFVAIPAFRPQPDAKRVLPVQGAFEENQTRLVYQDEVKMFIPLDKPVEGVNTEVVIGFQLSEDEIEFNRALRQR